MAAHGGPRNPIKVFASITCSPLYCPLLRLMVGLGGGGGGCVRVHTLDSDWPALQTTHIRARSAGAFERMAHRHSELANGFVLRSRLIVRVINRRD